MGTVLTMTGDEPEVEQPTPLKRRSTLAEQSEATFLLETKDGKGRTVYFYDCRVSGLHRRLFGPFSKKQAVYDLADLVFNQVLDTLCECQNLTADTDAQMFTELPPYVREGYAT